MTKSLSNLNKSYLNAYRITLIWLCNRGSLLYLSPPVLVFKRLTFPSFLPHKTPLSEFPPCPAFPDSQLSHTLSCRDYTFCRHHTFGKLTANKPNKYKRVSSQSFLPFLSFSSLTPLEQAAVCTLWRRIHPVKMIHLARDPTIPLRHL